MVIVVVSTGKGVVVRMVRSVGRRCSGFWWQRWWDSRGVL